MRLTLCAVLFACFALPASALPLRSAFYALEKQDRKELQVQLTELGLYAGAIDGLWGPGTANAFTQVQDSLAWPTYRDMAVALGEATPTQALWAYVSANAETISGLNTISQESTGASGMRSAIMSTL